MEYKQDNIGVTKPFTILVADLVDSRRVPDRAAFAKTLRATLDETAREFFEEWHAPLSVTKGIDELSGVLVRPARAYAIASFVDRAVWPQRFRWGLATGEVDVGVRGRKPGAMDGPGRLSAMSRGAFRG